MANDLALSLRESTVLEECFQFSNPVLDRLPRSPQSCGDGAGITLLLKSNRQSFRISGGSAFHTLGRSKRKSIGSSGAARISFSDGRRSSSISPCQSRDLNLLRSMSSWRRKFLAAL